MKLPRHFPRFRRLRQAIETRLSEKNFALRSKWHPLRYLFLELTRRCNYHCVYCGSDCSSTTPTSDELSAAEFIDILEQISRNFPAKTVMLALTGGEPLMKEGFFDICAAARRLGFPYGMVSNGALLTPEVAQKLVAHRMGSLSLSLDGPPDLHDQLRGKGAAKRVEAAIENLRAADYRGKLEILSTLTKPVIPRLDEFRRYVATLKVPLWRFSPVFPIGRAAQQPDFVPDAADLRVILDFTKQSRTDGLLPSPEFCEEGYLGVDYEEKVRPCRFVCSAGLTTGGILRDGRIAACPELADCFVQGDIRQERFFDVWQNRYQIFRDRSWTRHGQCADCDSFRACQGGSLHLYSDLKGEPSRCFYRMLKN